MKLFFNVEEDKRVFKSFNAKESELVMNNELLTINNVEMNKYKNSSGRIMSYLRYSTYNILCLPLNLIHQAKYEVCNDLWNSAH